MSIKIGLFILISLCVVFGNISSDQGEGLDALRPISRTRGPLGQHHPYPGGIVCGKHKWVTDHCPSGSDCAFVNEDKGWACSPFGNGHSVFCADTMDFCPIGFHCSATDSKLCIPNGKTECQGAIDCGLDSACDRGICIQPKNVTAAEGIGQCDRYRTIETNVHCGPGGYPMAYGLRYCRRFFERQNKFTDSGKRFIGCTAKCLLDKLDNRLSKGQGVGCDGLHQFAFGSHPDCYVQCGFCDVFPANVRAYVDVVELRDVQLSTVKETAGKCVGEYWTRVKRTVALNAQKLVQMADQMMEEVKKRREKENKA